MLKNVIFLLIYAFASTILSMDMLNYLLIFQCLLNIIDEIKQGKLIITPILVFYVSVIITNIANLTLVSKLGSRDVRIYSYIVPKYITEGTQLWCVSCSIMTIGYLLAVRKSFPPIDYILRDKKIVRTIFNVLLVMNVLTILGMGFNYRGGLVLRIFGLLNTIGILFFARLWGKEGTKKYRMYALTLYVLETYIALTTSFLRFELILPTIYLFTGYFIGMRDIRYVFSYRLIPFILIFVLYGSVFAALQRSRSNFISAFDRDDTNTEEQAQQPKSNVLLLDRCANIAQLTNVIKLVKQNGFYDGKASAPLVIALVPRFLWPDKPKIELGAWFALEIGGAYKSETGKINNSINMTIPGELYLDFGWIGVIVGSIFMGLFIGALWNSTGFYSSEYNITGIIFGGYLIFVALLGFGADLQIVITLISTYLSFFVIRKIVKSI